MIEAHRVSKTYARGVYALRELSLRIDKGDFVFLTFEPMGTLTVEGVIPAIRPDGGKTVVFAHAILHLLRDGERALVLAHRDELIIRLRRAPSAHSRSGRSASD